MNDTYLIGDVLLLLVIPAKAGSALQQPEGLVIHGRQVIENQRPWIPAFARMTMLK